MKKIKVTSTVRHRVGVNLPDLRFKRSWQGVGASINIDKEMFEELMYEAGFRYMLEQGILYIEDMAVKVEHGLEPAGATKPVNIIVLSDKERAVLLSEATSTAGFETAIKKLKREQLMELADYAIKHRTISINKARLLKLASGRDVLVAIRLAQDAEDAAAKEGK